jgi:autotransporter translocation and assembly factor TamB
MASLLLRWLRTLTRWVSLVVLIPLLVVATLLATPVGLKIIFYLLSQTLPGELHYQQVSGTLLGSVTIKQLSYRYQDQQVSMRGLSLQWHPSALLIDKISIENFHLDDLQIVTPQAPTPPATAPGSFSLKELKQQLRSVHSQLTGWRLPANLQVNHATIDQVVWREQPDKPTLQAIDVSLHGIISEEKLNATLRMRLQQPYAIQTDFTVEGNSHQYHFSLTAFNPQTHWVIQGQVAPDEIRLEAQKALIFSGELSVHLVWKWMTPMSWELTLLGRHLDLSAFEPDSPHPFDIDLKSTGDLAQEHPRVSWDGVLKTPQTQIRTQGRYDQQWDVHWDAQIRQLAEWLPFASGAINTTGELHGSLTQPQTKGRLEATLLRFKEYRIDKMNAQWDADISEAHRSSFQIIAEQLFDGPVELQKLQLSGEGKWGQHTLTATAHGYDTDVQWGLNGGFKADHHWVGSLQTFTVNARRIGVWKLSQPTALDLSPKGAAVTALCLQSAYQSQLCVRGQWNGVDDAWKIAVTSRLTLQQIAATAPEASSISMPVDLHFTAEGIGKTVQQMLLTGNTQGGDIRYGYGGSKALVFHVNSAELTGKLDKNGVDAQMRVALANNNLINISLALPKASAADLFAKDQSIEGKIDIALNSLAPIQALIPESINPAEKFSAHLTIGGTMGEPLINGQANLATGEIKIPGLNIQLNHINLAVQAQGFVLNYLLTATSANRPLRVTGQTRLNEAGLPTELTLTGDRVLLADTPVYTVYVTPNVHLTIKGRDIHVSGSVDIPQATLHKLEFQRETTLPEDEVIYIGEHPTEKTTPWNVSMELALNMGDEVKVDTPDLKAKIGGSLTILSQPGQVMLGIGRIDVSEGIYTVFGRQLKIMPGSGIIYRRNPLSNPTLSIQAVTQVNVTDPLSQQQLGTNEITVGMNIGGTSSSPQVTLFSSAGNLSQADMLSYLLLGTSSAGISPTNMNLMLQALNSLPLTKKGAGNVQGITNQVKQSLGLSELGVESETTLGPTGEAIPTTATPTSYFVVGKRLTSRIYLRYKYDPFNSVNLFQLNYLFSKNWSLQLETDGSTQSGIDVLYTIQTGTSKAASKASATAGHSQ